MRESREDAASGPEPRTGTDQAGGGSTPVTCAGHVALVGRPNAGKSTLLNALVGEKLSIVTARAQTTRDAVTGILTTDRAQFIFVDTPGLLEPHYALQQAMLETALSTLLGADVVLLLLDATRAGEVPVGAALQALVRRRAQLVVGINKADRVPAADASWAALERWCAVELEVEPRRLAALTGAGVDALRDAVELRLPLSPFLYPADELAVQPVRFFVAELVRETIFEMYEQEIPYSTVVRIDEFREVEEPVYIRATIYVERETQKPIVIGRGGTGIKALGAAARVKIEQFLGHAVYLDLWVKPMPGWRKRPSSLRHLGYPVPAADDDRSRSRGGGGRRGRRPDGET